MDKHKYVKWTNPKGYGFYLPIVEVPPQEYVMCTVANNQNKLRHMLSVLARTKVYGKYLFHYPYEVAITFDKVNNEYTLWAYSPNGTWKAPFLSGVLVGKRHLWERIQRKLYRRRQRRKSHG